MAGTLGDSPPPLYGADTPTVEITLSPPLALAETTLLEGQGHAGVPMVATAGGLDAVTLAGAPRSGERPDSGLARGAIVDRYVIVEQIGAGAMGVVWAAYDPYLDRKVALKLLPSATSGSAPESMARLMREAQALARLSHANVVAVHDVGITGGHVFVAMDYVRGQPLSAWLNEARRTWREVLAVFLQAGRGLAAAHAAGIIHRDFKPDNVIMGDDGIVRVIDFGLARASSEEPRPPPIELADLSTSGSSHGNALAMKLTHAGALMGTPAYMAPEQMRGGALDARSDQFSFCVALYEALYGERPFPGERLLDVYAAIAAGRVRPPPARSEVPAWLRKVLIRGLAAKPAERHPDLDALLRALAHDPTRLRARIAMAAAAVTAIGAAVIALRQPTTACQGAEAQLAGIWDHPRREAVQAAFRATGVPYAQEAWNGVAPRLDAYARSWVTMHRETCEATSVRREQSPAMLDLRMACLGQRLQELRAVSDVLAQADEKVVGAAVDMASKMSALDPCADTAALLAGARLPVDAATRAKVGAIRATLADVDALDRAGKIADALARATKAASDADAVDYLPAQAEALYWLGSMQIRAGDFRTAGATLLEAVSRAEAARHDAPAADAWTQLVFVAAREARYDDALRYATVARGAARRVGDLRAEARLASNVGTAYKSMGRYREAAEHLTRAVELWERIAGPDDPRAAPSVYNLGTVLSAQGKFAEAAQQYGRCLRIRERALGASHPSVGYPLIGLGNAALADGRWDLARAQLERALALLEKALGPEHANVANVHHSLGEAHRRAGSLPAALEHHTRALAIAEKALGPKHPDTALALTGLGSVRIDLGEPQLALTLLERALALRESNASQPEEQAETKFALARALVLAGGDRARAAALAEQAHASYASLGDGWSAQSAAIATWLASSR